jgi:mycofactocin precursor
MYSLFVTACRNWEVLMPESGIELLDPPAGEVADTQPDEGAVTTDDVIAADLLVEEISIDGMCGVY